MSGLGTRLSSSYVYSCRGRSKNKVFTYRLRTINYPMGRMKQLRIVCVYMYIHMYTSYHSPPHPPTHTHLHIPQFFSSSPLQKFPFTQLFASHRHKNNEIHKIFKTLPESEKLIDGT